MTALLGFWGEDQLIAVGVICGALVAVYGAWRTPFSRPIRWAGRKLIGDPLHTAVRTAVRAEISDVLHNPNGGHSLYDLGEAMKDVLGRLAAIEERQQYPPVDMGE